MRSWLSHALQMMRHELHCPSRERVVSTTGHAQGKGSCPQEAMLKIPQVVAMQMKTERLRHRDWNMIAAMLQTHSAECLFDTWL